MKLHRRHPWANLWLLHQSGWDEMLLIFGIPMALFIIMRAVAKRSMRKHDRAEETDET